MCLTHRHKQKKTTQRFEFLLSSTNRMQKVVSAICVCVLQNWRLCAWPKSLVSFLSNLSRENNLSSEKKWRCLLRFKYKWHKMVPFTSAKPDETSETGTLRSNGMEQPRSGMWTVREKTQYLSMDIIYPVTLSHCPCTKIQNVGSCFCDTQPDFVHSGDGHTHRSWVCLEEKKLRKRCSVHWLFISPLPMH